MQDMECGDTPELWLSDMPVISVVVLVEVGVPFVELVPVVVVPEALVVAEGDEVARVDVD